ncbi:reverse transcriptase [Elysia marginata]|uniref:Reverse transcriptase n=1 Tax=Elysia marginata TaxID=1093978 RepID=A0AAV4H474_9GAST|nr:reverse transcriptase [Elysia marginata]
MTLLDLSAAFDTIDRNILLTRLNQTFGLSGTVLQWFESYLSNRTQSVFIGDHTSRKLPLVFGVLQGSVLGPILFTLYTSPLSSIIKLHGMSHHLYADDTQMYCTDTINNLPLLLSKTSICIESVLKEWMMTNKLNLNDDKTEIIILGKDVHSIPTTTLNINVYPRLATVQISCVITVYITVERCLCFVIPLRVKTLLTPKRSAFVLLTIVVLALPNLALPYTAAKLDWRWDPDFNRTAIGLVLTRHDSFELLRINYMINLSLQLGSILALVLSNVALALSVNRQAKWRVQTTATTSQLGQTPALTRSTPNGVTTNRNKRLAKMTQFLSMIHFVTYFLSTSFYVVSLVLPGFRLYGRHHYEYLSCGTSAVVAQTLNSSINIVFYNRMNKSFRNTFNKMFRKGAVRVGIFITEHNAMNNTTT